MSACFLCVSSPPSVCCLSVCRKLTSVCLLISLCLRTSSNMFASFLCLSAEQLLIMAACLLGVCSPTSIFQSGCLLCLPVENFFYLPIDLFCLSAGLLQSVCWLSLFVCRPTPECLLVFSVFLRLLLSACLSVENSAYGSPLFVCGLPTVCLLANSVCLLVFSVFLHLLLSAACLLASYVFM